MTKRVWAVENFDQFAAAIDRMSERVGKLDDLGNVHHEGALSQIAAMAGEAYFQLTKEESPYDTGTLHDAHRKSEVKQTSTSDGFEAIISIFIDPDPTIENPKYGGFPGQYGPKYHRERLQWFAISAMLMEPLFETIMKTQVSVYFEGFWD